MALESLTIGPARFRIGPWHEDRWVAYLVPLTTAITFRPEVLASVRTGLIDRGFSSVYTAAVGPAERDVLAADEYTVHDELHLLRHDLRPPLPHRPRRHDVPRLRRGRSHHHTALLAVDAKAFGSFWRLDADGLYEALHATPVSRIRIAGRSELTGYSIAGRAGPHGYLQRLAVAPGTEGRGIGTALVADALHWLRRGHATSVMVNTQIENDRALDLYERLGFVRQADRLTVLHRSLE